MSNGEKQIVLNVRQNLLNLKNISVKYEIHR